MKLAITVLLTITLLGAAEKSRFDNYRVYNVNVTNKHQLKVLELLHESQNAIEFWKFPKNVGENVHILVPPAQIADFSQLMLQNNFESEILINNLQKLIDEEQPSGGLSRNFGWDAYYDLSKIYEFLDSAVENYPVVTPFSLGKSYEGRDIRGVKISYGPQNPGVFLEANIHAREWIASATATFVINELLTSKDPRVRSIAESVDWYIVPVLNVDGFVYSHSFNRMWRKTRQQHHPTCVGTDPNRNFDVYWMANGGASADPCDETYAGPKPFSEPETKAVADFVEGIRDDINVYIAFHSYGQYILTPYGHTGSEKPPNYDDMQQINKKVVEAIGKRYGTSYVYGSTGSTLYIASGTSPDWAYNKSLVSLGFTFEFRDKGKYGFILPASEIVPNSLEALDGLVALVEEAKELNYL